MKEIHDVFAVSTTAQTGPIPVAACEGAYDRSNSAYNSGIRQRHLLTYSAFKIELLDCSD
jgi:hypothetical protein